MLYEVITLAALAACSPETRHPQPVNAIYEMPIANPLPFQALLVFGLLWGCERNNFV